MIRMDMKYINTYLKFVFLILLLKESNSQCTFGTTFAGTTWHDSTRGTLTFLQTTMSGWSFTFRSSVQQTVSSWQCVDHTTDATIVLRTVNRFTIAFGSGTKQVYGYSCMMLTNVTDVSFYYYLQHIQQFEINGERLKVSENAALTMSDVCDTTITIPTPEFHVLVKSGSESSAAITCPDSILVQADYIFTATDGTTSCTTSVDVWDVCSTTSEVTFDYTTCSTEVAFSSGGKLWCVAALYSGDVTYVSLYNQDSSIVSTTRRFSCIATDGKNASVAPNNCTAFQTPYDFPKAADQTTPLGHQLYVETVTVDCGTVTSTSTSSGLSGGAIAAIVLSVLYLMFTSVTVAVVVVVLFLYILTMFLVVIYDLSGFHDSDVHDKRAFNKGFYTDKHIDVENHKDLDTDKVKVPLEDVVVTNPEHVVLTNGKATVFTNGTSKPKNKPTPQRKNI